MNARHWLIPTLIVPLFIAGIVIFRSEDRSSHEEDVPLSVKTSERAIVDLQSSDVLGRIADAKLDSTGRVWIVDDLNRQIHRIEMSGEITTRWGGRGQGPGEFMNPTALAVTDDATRIAVLDVGSGRLTVWNEAGDLLLESPVEGSRAVRPESTPREASI